MIDYTIAEFLGIFLIAFPFLFFVTVLLVRGIFWVVDPFFIDETNKNLFHHHFHHRDKNR